MVTGGTGTPVTPWRRDNLQAPVPHDGGERGHSWDGRVLRRSLFTLSRLHPKRTALAVAALGALGYAGFRARNGKAVTLHRV